jgi:hypothetical protein
LTLIRANRGALIGSSPNPTPSGTASSNLTRTQFCFRDEAGARIAVSHAVAADVPSEART